MRRKENMYTMLLIIAIVSFAGYGIANEISLYKKTKEATVTPATITSEQAETTPEEILSNRVEEEPEIPENGIAFSRTDNFYPEGTEFKILSNKKGRIYYTTDGTEPNEEKTFYSGAIKLETRDTLKVISIKAKAYFDDGTESDTIVRTFFIGAEVASRYDTLIFSVTTNPDNLYDYEKGIFVLGKIRDDFITENPGAEINPASPANFNMRGKEAEREVYLEVFEPNGNRIIDQAAGIRTYGGWSRAREQKSFKIFARKEYDQKNSKLNYAFFPYKTSSDGKGNILDSFKQLVLRNCGNDNGFAFIRDELFETLAGQAGYLDYEAVRPAAVYLNGEYRGFFWLHEVYCDEYFKDHYGDYKGKFEILEGGENFKTVDADGANEDLVYEYTDLYDTYSGMDLTDDANYLELCKAIDVKNYLEYYALQTYIGNEDWPHNNYKTYRYYAAEGEEYREAPFDGKWRYLIHDLDFSFGIYGTPPTTNFLEKYVGNNGEIREACPLFGQLMKREDCREIFIKKTLDLINGSFSQTNLNKVLDEMNAARLNELKRTYNRGLLEAWVIYDQLPGRLNDIKSWGKTRAIFTMDSYSTNFKLTDVYQLNVKVTDGCRVKINSFATDSDFEGYYYTDYTTEINAFLPLDKQFDYWLVNGEKVESEKLTITSAMIKDNLVEVSFVTK